HTRSKRDWSSDVCSSDLFQCSQKHHILQPHYSLLLLHAQFRNALPLLLTHIPNTISTLYRLSRLNRSALLMRSATARQVLRRSASNSHLQRPAIVISKIPPGQLSTESNISRRMQNERKTS